jgi:NAD(P)-dependent dehydrogenase (short-subunit alcohol dehydrogenase family)
MAAAGAQVLLCGRGADGVARAVSELNRETGGRVSGVAADVSKWDECRKLFDAAGQRFGGLDVLVNNAGVGVFRPVAQIGPEEWHQVIDLNLNGVFYCSRLALPLFARRGGGYIIQISSLAGKNAFAGGAAYNASKFAVNGFSEAMMQDVRYDNVRVSYVMPGSVDTEFTAGSGDGSWKIAPEDVAQVVMGLLQMPARTLVSRVEIRPSKPKK